MAKTIFTLILSACLLFACSNSGQNYAPVKSAWSSSDNQTGYYVVQADDTLYAVAWRYNLDHRKLAVINGIEAPYALKVGQKLRISDSYITKKKHKSTKNTTIVNKKGTNTSTKQSHKQTQQQKRASARAIVWQWPVQGSLLQGFKLGREANKGINIRGERGKVIRAAATGEVAYSGHSLPGYGNLLIIKHSEEFLSAYAHNERLLVHEGDKIRAGQKIAMMGDTDAQQVMLHFEIRRSGKPVDPLRYLPRKE